MAFIKYFAIPIFALFFFAFSIPFYIQANAYYFHDEFNEERSSNILDPQKWTIFQNTSNSVTTIKETGGSLQLSQQDNTHQFPLIISKYTLPEEDFSIDIKFQYTKVVGGGTGFALSESSPTNGGGFSNVFTISVWQDLMPYLMRIGYGDGMSAERIVYQTSSTNLNEHLFTVKHYNQKYFIFLDNQLIYTSQVTTKKLKYFWFGNPDNLITSVPAWSFFKVDYVRVTEPPKPFLDLPWDYNGKGLSFNEAALSINSFFDHQYPLLSRGLDLSEPANTISNIVNYLGQTTNDSYSKHDGYDYGNLAEAKLNDPVLAAASGSATFINSCSSCGNMIVIDHGNGYQTRYMHLSNNGLITNTSNQPIHVDNHQQIGKVGFSGNVWPPGKNGAHIHFGVFQDKNSDGNFNDNEPDGVTDPYGWQSNLLDPWENYTFNYLGQNRKGNRSYYLWKNNLANMASLVTPTGATLSAGNYTVNFPQNSTNQNIIVDIKSAPVVQSSDKLISLGSILLIKATDTAGGAITTLQNLYNIVLNFASLDLSKIKTDTLSFYSSSNGINWIKENTIFPTLTSAQTQLNHMSYFALLGERKDTTSPTTTSILYGSEGQPTWFDSDVKVSLDASDNEGGLGVEYTLYRINEGEIQEYNTPINLTDEGHYKVEFYSVDNDDNIEPVKTIEFYIDKTSPQISLDVSPHILWPPNNKMTDVQILGNASDNNDGVSTSFKITDEYGLIQPQVTNFDQIIQLEAGRKGNDTEGRVYTVEATSQDKAGNTTTKQTQILVPHDQGKN